MSDLDVRLVGLQTLQARLDSTSPTLRARLRIFMAAFTIRLQAQVKFNILDRFKSDGPLYQGVQSEVSETIGGVTGRAFIDDVPYAAIQEGGGRTRPHEIVPVNGSTLAFLSPAGLGFSSNGGANGLVFAKKVNHPGSNIPERSYARLALVQLRGDFVDGIRGVVDDAVAVGYAIAAE